MFFFNYHTRVF